jgi:hypothetical protein
MREYTFHSVIIGLMVQHPSVVGQSAQGDITKSNTNGGIWKPYTVQRRQISIYSINIEESMLPVAPPCPAACPKDHERLICSGACPGTCECDDSWVISVQGGDGTENPAIAYAISDQIVDRGEAYAAFATGDWTVHPFITSHVHHTHVGKGSDQVGQGLHTVVCNAFFAQSVYPTP